MKLVKPVEAKTLRDQMIQMIQAEGREPTEELIAEKIALAGQQEVEPGLEDADPTDLSPKGLFKGVAKMFGKQGMKKALKKVDPDTFNETIKKASEQNPHIKKMLSEHPKDQLSKMKKYVDEETGSGFAIKPDGEITNVFSATKGQGSRLIEEAKKKGGVKLDHFESGPLSKTYEKAGFKEVKREPNWTPGEPDVVFRELSEGPTLLERIKEAAKKSNIKVKDLNTTGAETFENATDEYKRKALLKLLGREE